MWCIFLIVMGLNTGTWAESKDWTPKKISLEELLEKSRIIVVAEPDPASDEELSPEPCLAVSRGYKVQAVVRNLTQTPTAVDSKIHVLPYVHFQMKNRCSKTGYIRNFSQEQYVPRRPPGKSERTILFLTDAFKNLYFRTIDSAESSTRLEEIIKLAPLRCQEMKTQYEAFLKTLPDTCSADGDCAAFDYDTLLGGCEHEVFHQHSLDSQRREFLGLVAKKAKDICPKPISECEKIQVIPACRHKQCVNLVRDPDAAMFSAEGVFRHSCAPTDGPALQFVVPVRGGVANLTISLYQKFPVVGESFSAAPSSAAYCPGQRTCVPAESAILTLEKFGGDHEPTPGSFTLKFRNGRALQGKSLFKPDVKASPLRCG